MRDEGILVYGAAGYMGALVVREAYARGIATIAAGRRSDRLTCLANELGLECRSASLTDPAALRTLLHGVRVLVNAAGPFSSTWRPLVDACLASGVHYVDLTGEVNVFEGIRTRGAEARTRGLMLMPGVGFDVVPSDCLASYVAAQVPRARTLRLAISGLELLSRGSARTLVEMLDRSLVVRRGGRLVHLPMGALERTFDFGAGPSSSVAVSWGDLGSAFNTTGIPNIETYFEATPAVRAMVGAHRLLGPVLSLPPWQAILRTATSALPEGPTASERRARRAIIVAEAEDARGRVARARLRTPEAYTLSAQTAVTIAADVAAGHVGPGFQTPAGLFGARYILQFPDVHREDLPPRADARETASAATAI